MNSMGWSLCVAARSGRSVCLAVCAFLAIFTPARAEEWVSIGPFAGRTATALFGESFLGGTFLYAAIEDAGVFRSADLGSTWIPLNSGLTNTRVSDFAAHRIELLGPTGCPPPCYGPSTIYAATRGGGVFVLRNDRWTADNSGLTDLEVNALAADSIGIWAGTAGGRIFRNIFALVGPQTWSRVGSPGDGTAVLSLAFASGGTLFCGTAAGFYRSTNGGSSWSRLQQNTLQFLADVRAIAVDPSDPSTIYAAGILACNVCSIPVGPSIVKSTDGGQTWTEVTTNIGNPFLRSLLTTTGGDVFAGTASGVFRSIDGGLSWMSTGLEGREVVALTETPFPFSEAISLAAGTVGAGLYRADLPILGCRLDDTTLCLTGRRFSVRVFWHTTRGGQQSGDGQTMPLTSDSGAFWFFQPSNIELVVKVLDGRAINGHFWVFWGALTDVGYTITVTDTVTGTQKIYTNPDGQLASGADTETF